MIGQTQLLNKIDRYIESGFPRFTIICGPKGSGKHEIVSFVANRLGANVVTPDLKVAGVREIISLAYKQTQPTIYLLADADKMHPSAKNALLKITEEPPRQAYFILTLTDASKTLETLRSRACVLNMDPYTVSELRDYVEYKGYELSLEELQFVLDLCTTPGEIETLVRYDISEFKQFLQTVVDNIGVVNGANAFKIGNKLSYKDDDGGWDIKLFISGLIRTYHLNVLHCKKSTKCCYDSLRVLSEYLQQLDTIGINKSATIDMLILQLRGIWVE